MRALFRSQAPLIGLIAFLLVAVCVVVGIIGSPRTALAQPVGSAECNVVIVLDRSASIGDNWTIMRNQVLDLFSAGGLDRDDISLAFWTFSHVSNTTGVNYNAPYHDYVRSSASGAELNGFRDSLDSVELGGQTNYEQGFSYSQGIPNNMGDIDDIRSRADVVAFLTDGAPNYPGGSDNNEIAIAAGYAARDQYPPSVSVIGGYISNIPGYVPISLYRTINGNSDTSADNVGPLEFGNLNEFLLQKIPPVCNVDLPDYSLVPHANLGPGTEAAVQSEDTASFVYSTDNETSDGSSGTSGWQLYDVTIQPSVSGNPLDFTSSQSACPTGSGRPYCNLNSSQESENCQSILNMIGGRGTCDSVPTGGRGTCGGTPSTSPGNGNYTFAPGINAFYSPPRCQTIGDLPLGTRICSILSITKPTGAGSPTHRISSAACVVIGKTPLVQVHGGDVRVGRAFSDDDPLTGPDAGVFTSRFKIPGAAVPNGRTFGSWVEYGVLAPGPIEKVASLSGYAGPNGGYDEMLSTASCDLNVNKLTFANTVADPSHNTECGYFAEDVGEVPDIVTSLTSRQAIASPPNSPIRFDQNSQSGLYRYTTNTAIEIGESIVANSPTEKGKTFIVYVPQGTVTIIGNIVSANDAYGSINEIPQLVIIARDIKIRENVVRVDAWLVADGDSNGGGTIDTCVGYTPPFSSTVCKEELRINGPIMARELDLWRTKVSEERCEVVAIEDCREAGAPAEIINLPGSSILWAQGYGANSSRAQTSYTIELPPYF